MIDLKFGLFWSGSKLSYLRYLTFLSLRKHHPSAEIELYYSKSNNLKVKWGRESQDFQNYNGECYLSKLEELGVKIIKTDMFNQYPPNFQSDFFRWWWLYNNGGFYLDTDQIILKSFGDLPLESDLIYSIYQARSCGVYAPVGVIGAKKDSPIVKTIMDKMTKYYEPNVYNSIGPFMFLKVYTENEKMWNEKFVLYNSPSYTFYPIAESFDLGNIYEENINIINASYSLHWFGGHSKSQEFNKKFDEEYALKNKDTISVLSRKLI